MTIAQQLREARQSASLTQIELAKRLGIHQSQISEIERGKHQPRASLFVKWLKACADAPLVT